MMHSFPVPNWFRDTFSKDIGSHRKIKKIPSDCVTEDLYLKFKNKHARCIHYWVYDKEGKVYMGQDTKHGCLNSEYHVCVPKGGKVRTKGTTHCGGQKLASSTITYDTLKTHNNKSNGLGWWDWIIGKKEKDIVPIRARCVDKYPRFYLNGDKDRYYGDPATKR
jgi:hypothetical protein